MWSRAAESFDRRDATLNQPRLDGMSPPAGAPGSKKLAFSRIYWL